MLTTIKIFFFCLIIILIIHFLIKNILLEKSLENNIEQILEESVSLFLKIGLVDLAQKWELILYNYRSSI